MLHKTGEISEDVKTVEKPKRRRFSIFGILFRFLFAIAIIVGAVFYARAMISDRPEPPERQPRERTFTVQSIPAEFGDFQPNLTYFGELQAATKLDIRSQVAGKVVNLAEGLAVGNAVAKGTLLASIDDFTYGGALTEAKASLAEAKFGLTEAKERLSLENANLDFVRSQLDLSKRDLERAKSLFEAGSITEKSLDDRELLVSQREQALLQRESNIIIQQAQLDRQQAALERSEWQVERAERNLEDTKIFAPFDGIVTANNIELGRVISNNEVLISLYETSAIDVRFTMSDQQYGQLLDDGLIGRNVVVKWEVEPQPIIANAQISRTGAQIDASKGGVEIFARVDAEKSAQLRPGTFVKIEVPGLKFENMLRLPETAIYDNQYIYIDDDGRMSRRDVEIIARDGQYLLARAQFDAATPIITSRIAQAGEGVAIVNEGEPTPFARPNRQRDENAERRQSGDRPARERGQRQNNGSGNGEGQAPVEADNVDQDLTTQESN
ncbi:efflux RND transporter periplasmic adaptor subunit [Maritalea sp.]|uniref:efflux RND transporter periplasmic adaptor subunit n=1 Tax=Maritalea sp. TaxID=2003361 RepID=UPI003EF47DD0